MQRNTHFRILYFNIKNQLYWLFKYLGVVVLSFAHKSPVDTITTFQNC